jgi:hypothetical protein
MARDLEQRLESVECLLGLAHEQTDPDELVLVAGAVVCTDEYRELKQMGEKPVQSAGRTAPRA